MGEQGHGQQNSDHEQQTQNPDGKSHLSLLRVRGPGSLAFQGLVVGHCAGTGTHASGQLGAVG